MESKDGGPEETVFKFIAHEDAHVFVMPALTKREWFAGMALQGLLSCLTDQMGLNRRVVLSYRYADAMLKEGANNV